MTKSSQKSVKIVYFLDKSFNLNKFSSGWELWKVISSYLGFKLGVHRSLVSIRKKLGFCSGS